MFLFGYPIQSDCDFQDNANKPSVDLGELTNKESKTDIEHLHIHTVDENGVSSGASEEAGTANMNQVCLCYLWYHHLGVLLVFAK